MNKAVDYNPGLVKGVRINSAAVSAYAKNLGTRRTFKNKEQAVAYFHAIACMDLTTLRGDDTFGRVDRLCAKALQPVRPDLFRAVREKFSLPDFDLRVGAVCVYPKEVEEAVRATRGLVPVASVATGFPSGQTFDEVKGIETKLAVAKGAMEIDVVISRDMALGGDWLGVYSELVRFRKWCGEGVALKTILEVSDLQDLNIIAKASLVAMMAGADFIKTSTGLGDHGATPEAVLVMAWQIDEFLTRYGIKVGLKVAGGVRTAKEALGYLVLMYDALGSEWTEPKLFRIGASSLLTDVEMQLEHLATGSYSAPDRHPKG